MDSAPNSPDNSSHDSADLRIIDELKQLRKEALTEAGLWSDRVEALFSISNLEFSIIEGEDPTRFLHDPLFWHSYSHRKGFCRESHENDENPLVCPLDEEYISPYAFQNQPTHIQSQYGNIQKQLGLQQPSFQNHTFHNSTLSHADSTNTLTNAATLSRKPFYEIIQANEVQSFESYISQDLVQIYTLLDQLVLHKQAISLGGQQCRGSDDRHDFDEKYVVFDTTCVHNDPNSQHFDNFNNPNKHATLNNQDNSPSSTSHKTSSNTVQPNPNWPILSYSDYLCLTPHLPIFAADPEGNSLMHWISLNSNISLFQIVLHHLYTPATLPFFYELLNKPNNKGETPLFWAIYTGHLGFIQLLLLYGAIPFTRNSSLSSIFHLAARRGHLLLLDFFNLQYLAPTRKLAQFDAIIPADSVIAAQITREMLSTQLSDVYYPTTHNTRTEAKATHTLQTSVRSGGNNRISQKGRPNQDVFQQNPNHRDSSHCSSFISQSDLSDTLKFYPDFIKQLIFQQVHALATLSTPSPSLQPFSVHTPTFPTDASFLQYFTTRFPVITLNTVKFYPRFLQFSDLTAFSLNGLDSNGKSPLHWAVYNNFPSLTRWFVTHNANLYIQDLERCFPLHWAVLKGNHECVDILLQKLQRMQKNDILEHIIDANRLRKLAGIAFGDVGSDGQGGAMILGKKCGYNAGIGGGNGNSISSVEGDQDDASLLSSIDSSSDNYNANPFHINPSKSYSIHNSHTATIHDFFSPPHSVNPIPNDPLISQVEHIYKTTFGNGLLGLAQIYHADITKNNPLQLLNNKLNSLHATNGGRDIYHYCEEDKPCSERTGHSWAVETAQPSNFVEIYKFTKTSTILSKYATMHQRSIQYYGLRYYIQQSAETMQANFFVLITVLLFIAHILAFQYYIVPFTQDIPLIAIPLYPVVWTLVPILVYSWLRAAFGNPGYISSDPLLDFRDDSYVLSVGDIQQSGVNSHYFLTNHANLYHKLIASNMQAYFPPREDGGYCENTSGHGGYAQLERDTQRNEQHQVDSINTPHQNPVDFNHPIDLALVQSNTPSIRSLSKKSSKRSKKSIKNCFGLQSKVVTLLEPPKQHCVEFVAMEPYDYHQQRVLDHHPNQHLSPSPSLSISPSSPSSISSFNGIFAVPMIFDKQSKNPTDKTRVTSSEPMYQRVGRYELGQGDAIHNIRARLDAYSLSTTHTTLNSLPINPTQDALLLDSEDTMHQPAAKTNQHDAVQQGSTVHPLPDSKHTNLHSLNSHPRSYQPSDLDALEPQSHFSQFLKPSFQAERDLNKYLATIRSSLSYVSLRASFFNTVQRFTTLVQMAENPKVFAMLQGGQVGSESVNTTDTINTSNNITHNNLSTNLRVGEKLHTIGSRSGPKTEHSLVNSNPPLYQIKQNRFQQPLQLDLEPNPSKTRFFSQLLQSHVCLTCGIERPVRSKHCRELDICIHKFDHFCVFLNNAVGAGNYVYFIIFLLTALILLSLFVVTGIFTLRLMYSVEMKYLQTILDTVSVSSRSPTTHSTTPLVSGNSLVAVGLLDTMSLYGTWYGNILLITQNIQFTSLLLILALSSAIIGIIYNLLALHIQLILSNMTTNEYLNKHKYSYLQLASHQIYPISLHNSRSPLQDTFINPFGFDKTRNIKAFLGISANDAFATAFIRLLNDLVTSTTTTMFAVLTRQLIPHFNTLKHAIRHRFEHKTTASQNSASASSPGRRVLLNKVQQRAQQKKDNEHAALLHHTQQQQFHRNDPNQNDIPHGHNDHNNKCNYEYQQNSQSQSEDVVDDEFYLNSSDLDLDLD